MIPYGRQDISQEDIDAVTAVLRSDNLTQGPTIVRFEQAVCDQVGAAFGVSVNSATSALHIACLSLGLGPGDWLWTVPNTFVASANCGRYCGANIDFVDIEPTTWNMSVAALQEKLVRADALGRLPKIVVPVHFAGQPTDQEAIWKLGKRYGFRIIEDASHAIGASRLGEAVGNCRWSDITVFSFHPVKIVTTAEGGMATTSDEDLATRMMTLRTHGITRESSRMICLEGETAPPWYYEQQALGYNYRITDVAAALGISQLTRLHKYVDKRNDIARVYDDALARMPLQLPFVRAENRSAFHLYVIRLIDPDPQRHRRVFERLRQAGIGVNLHYIPVHLHPYYRDLGFAEDYCPEAERHAQSAISLPLYPTLTNVEQAKVVQALAAALES